MFRENMIQHTLFTDSIACFFSMERNSEERQWKHLLSLGLVWCRLAKCSLGTLPYRGLRLNERGRRWRGVEVCVAGGRWRCWGCQWGRVRGGWKIKQEKHVFLSNSHDPIILITKTTANAPMNNYDRPSTLLTLLFHPSWLMTSGGCGVPKIAPPRDGCWSKL
jgi:hypothetical protein